MKLFNPFKAHIVQFSNGKYAVRRWNFLAWEYRENWTNPNVDVYWWNAIEFVMKWCMVDTHEQAAVLRDKVHVKAPRLMKVEKVYG